MKICLYSPYVPEYAGGGEKYFFDVAKTLVELGHDVSVAMTLDLAKNLTFTSARDHFAQVLDHEQIRQKYETFFDEALTDVKFIPAPFNGATTFWQRLAWTKQWDVLYYITDGSLFFSRAAKNVVHIQIPFTDAKTRWTERLKLKNWSVKNTNSQFTKHVVEQAWKTTINYVHYPMIEPPSIPANLMALKEKMILHVGRFFRDHHSKRQDVLVDIFQELLQKYPNETAGWQLVLIGTIEDQSYFDEVRQKANGWPIQLLQVNRQELWRYYQHAKIYWHATGFDLNEREEPAKMEHFGISTVEAMSMGCVPVVIGQGGQVEVVGPDLQNLLWKTKDECILNTRKMMTHAALCEQEGMLAQIQARQFGPALFKETLTKMIG